MGIRHTVMTVAAAGALATAGLAVAAPASADPSIVVVNCAGKGVVKPKQIVVSCADAAVMVTGIRWSRWNMNAAQGTGTLVWNTCLPTTCVDGIVEKYRVRITLGGQASGPDINVFSQMTLVFPAGGPAAAETATYTLDNDIR